ncbi:hypothetical protein BDR26DRAFT_466806 [Obelidium mucronatum]|nr:hypothetical protein BDR26DRAFT_466806 [Obelidium mucronatum]
MMKSTPFSSLPKYMDPFISKRYHLHSETHTVTPKEHWVFFAEILNVSFLLRPRVKVHLGNNKTATIHFEPELIHQVPKTFEWDDLEPGNTIVILYAQRKLMGDGEWGVKQEYLDTVFVVSAGVEMVSRYARQIFDTNRTCFHPKCGKTKGLMTCGNCSVAMFCSDYHQKDSRHDQVCKSSENIQKVVEICNGLGGEEFHSFAKNDSRAAVFGSLVLKAVESKNEMIEYPSLGLMPIGDDFIVDLKLDHLFPPATE